jgi:cytochrome c biogenesis protein CcdA
MEFLIPSLFSGMLTILAPCVLSTLPVIIGGSLSEQNKWRPLLIVGSLAVSMVVFTLLLKVSTALIGIPQDFWKWFSGVLVTLFGISILFPSLWEKVAFKLKLYKSESLIAKSNKKTGWKGAVLLGAALGPVFTTCSPTYVVILAIVLPQSFFIGVLNLIAFAIGLSIPLLAIGYGGQSVCNRFKVLANPNGWFKRGLGVLLIVSGLLIFTGIDKDIEAYLIKSGYLGALDLEQSLIDNTKE